jgi:succinoglycan biosynthesis protein ExoA
MITVSVIVPCYNEESTIALLLDALWGQSYPRQQMEVVVADALSTDGTRRAIADWQAVHPGLVVRVIDNPKRHIPAAVNLAVRAAQGQIIVRLDGHSQPRPDYVERCVAALQGGLGDNVGGVWEIRPQEDAWQARSIAAAAAHKLGVGDALYRTAERSGAGRAVDTVPFGSFYKAFFERIGAFDETLLSNEDYEFNVRVRQAGGTVWLDPQICSVYFARRNLRELARQYGRYGYWKARMLRRYPRTIRWRQALPPLFVLSLLGLAALALVWPLVGWIFALELGAYALILSLAGLLAAYRRRDWALLPGLPLAIATMHLAWGSAFLWSVVSR